MEQVQFRALDALDGIIDQDQEIRLFGRLQCQGMLMLAQAANRICAGCVDHIKKAGIRLAGFFGGTRQGPHLGIILFTADQLVIKGGFANVGRPQYRHRVFTPKGLADL